MNFRIPEKIYEKIIKISKDNNIVVNRNNIELPNISETVKFIIRNYKFHNNNYDNLVYNLFIYNHKLENIKDIKCTLTQIEIDKLNLYNEIYFKGKKINYNRVLNEILYNYMTEG